MWKMLSISGTDLDIFHSLLLLYQVLQCLTDRPAYDVLTSFLVYNLRVCVELWIDNPNVKNCNNM